MNNKSDGSHPTISVVIPAYNEEERIERTLKSLTTQTNKALEIIVADNNSTDKTTEIAKKYGALVVSEHQQGYVFALNTGLKATKGEVVAIIDADSKPDLNWLETIGEEFKNENVVALTGPIHVDLKSNLLKFISEKGYSAFLGINFLIGKPHLTGFNFAVRRSALLKVNGLDIKFAMSPDVDLGIRLSKTGKVIFAKNTYVTASTRRFRKGVLRSLFEYAEGYIYAAWLRKPPPVRQNVIR